MSTVGVTPTCEMSLANAVFGEVASASVTLIGDRYGATLTTHQVSFGQPLAPPLPRPLASNRPGTSSWALIPMAISSAAAVVKILKTDPAPSPTSENGCGRMVSPASLFSP